MITSLILALVGYTLLAGTSILDKFILSGPIKKPSVYAYYSTVFFFAVFLFLPFCQNVSRQDMLISTISGLAFGFGIWTMYKALESGETSHISPFIGAMVAVATFGLSSAFLGEELLPYQMIGLLLLVISCFLFSYEKSETKTGILKGFIWATVSGLLFGVSHVSAKYIYDIYPFITGIVWTKGTVSLVAVIALFMPSVIKQLKEKKTPEKTKGTKLMVIDRTISIVGTLLIQYSIAIGSVTLVNALAGAQYAMMFIAILVLTKFKPKIFSEFFTKKEVFVETLATVIMVIGLFFLK